MGAVIADGGRLLEWASAGLALERGASGDVHVVAEFAHGVLVGVIDGLGHGVEAAAAAHEAARLLASCAGEPLRTLVERCHDALRGTRGAVMSLASFDARERRMTWGGVGNVEGVLVRAHRGLERPRESIGVRGGIVGYHLPTFRESTVSVSPGDVLAMATDGIREEFMAVVSVNAPPQEIADAIVAKYARGSDDALVLVARVLDGAEAAAPPGGGAPP